MKESAVCVTSGIKFEGEEPYIETRARVIHSAHQSLPEGRVLVVRTPILPPGASDEEIRAATTTEIIYD